MNICVQLLNNVLKNVFDFKMAPLTGDNLKMNLHCEKVGAMV